MARELLLAQSSDWAFQIYQGTTVEYSSRRFQSHIHRFDLLSKMLPQNSPPYEGGVDAALGGRGGSLTTDQLELLTEIESRDNIFAEIDFRSFCSR
jgi:1,4-alpha-glucan branching enzyme